MENANPSSQWQLVFLMETFRRRQFANSESVLSSEKVRASLARKVNENLFEDMPY